MVIDSPHKQHFIGNITLPTGRENFCNTYQYSLNKGRHWVNHIKNKFSISCIIYVALKSCSKCFMYHKIITRHTNIKRYRTHDSIFEYTKNLDCACIYQHSLYFLHLAGVTNFRINAILSGGIWRFSDQREITTFYWGAGEPSSGYTTICISLATYLWNDVHVNYNHAVLCEKVL